MMVHRPIDQAKELLGPPTPAVTERAIGFLQQQLDVACGLPGHDEVSPAIEEEITDGEGGGGAFEVVPVHEVELASGVFEDAHSAQDSFAIQDGGSGPAPSAGSDSLNDRRNGYSM
jgi:hypothetical protein